MEEKTQKGSPQVLPAAPDAGKKQLPSFGTIYKEAWALLKEKFTTILKLFFLTLAAIVGVIAVLGIAIFLGSMVQGVADIFYILVILGMLILIVFYAISIIYISTISQIAYIKLLVSPTKLPVIQTLKDSKALIWPVITTTLLSQLLIIGGIFAFLIPGLIMAMLFVFVSYVVVTENLTGKAALRRSYQLVRPHFKKIFFIFVLFSVSANIVSEILGRFAGENAYLYLLSIPFSIFVGLYSQTLSVVVYKNAKAIASSGTPISLRWMKIWAIIGYVIFGLLVAASIFYIISSFMGAGSSLTLPPIPEGEV